MNPSQTLSKKIEEVKIPPNSFYKGSITLKQIQTRVPQENIPDEDKSLGKL